MIKKIRMIDVIASRFSTPQMVLMSASYVWAWVPKILGFHQFEVGHTGMFTKKLIEPVILRQRLMRSAIIN